MATVKRKEILTAIIKNILMLAICIGLSIAYPDKGFLRFLCGLFGTVYGIGLYIGVRNYIYYPIKNKEQKKTNNYNKKTDDFKKQMDDLLKDLYEQRQRQQDAVRIHNGMSVTDAYRLMKLKYSDTPDFIKKRYRELAMQWHPDKFATESKSKQETANRNFQKLNSAYGVIRKHKNIA